MSDAGSVTAVFPMLQQASEELGNVAGSVAGLSSLATTQGAAATGCPDTTAAIGALGTAVVQ